jgi:hypothetical protein
MTIDNRSSCAHCGEYPAVTLRLNKAAVENGEESLDGLGIGWSETLDVIEDHDTGESEDEYTLEDFCSLECIHFAGEFEHGMSED